MTTTRARMPGCHDGFTVIELAVTVAIIAILAAISLSQYAAYKRNSVDSEVQSSLHHARTAMEAYYETSHDYTAATMALLEDFGYRPSAGVTTVIVSANPSDYLLRACANGGNYVSFRYSSATGNIAPDTTPCF